MEWVAEVQSYLWGDTLNISLNSSEHLPWGHVVLRKFPMLLYESLFAKWLEHPILDATAPKSRHPKGCGPGGFGQILGTTFSISRLSWLSGLWPPFSPTLYTPHHQPPQAVSLLPPSCQDFGVTWANWHPGMVPIFFLVFCCSPGDQDFALSGAWSMESSPPVSPQGSCLPHVQKILAH